MGGSLDRKDAFHSVDGGASTKKYRDLPGAFAKMAEGPPP